MRPLLALIAVMSLCVASNAQTGAPPDTRQALPPPPTTEQLGTVQSRLVDLDSAVAALKTAGADDDLIVDAEAGGWAVHNMLRFPEAFDDSQTIDRCLSIISDSLRRAQQIKDNTAAWPKLTGRVNRAYRSAVDGTAQPYHLIIPASYDPAKPIPLYVYLHGRSHIAFDFGLTWVGGADRGGGNATDSNYIRLECFGRGNSSFRWAGETDVLEAIASVRKRYNIDPQRIVLSGFSMGGAGSWQLGLHRPDLFCALEIDAGVVGNRLNLDGLDAVQRAQTSPYGVMLDHAINTLSVPLVAYAGERDAQLIVSKTIAKQLAGMGFPILQISNFESRASGINALFLVTPRQGHSHATGQTAQNINTFIANAIHQGRADPDEIRFVTYTLRYNRDYWITIDSMTKQFNRATVLAMRDPARTAVKITTDNISRLDLAEVESAKQITIDGDVLSVPADGLSPIAVERDGGHWRFATSDAPLRKRHDLQGPIEDAFMDSFLCVLPSGTPDDATTKELAIFDRDFGREYCGKVRTKQDADITPQDIAGNNLILFGDPSNNKLIAQIADKLPIHWRGGTIVAGGATYSAAGHIPVLIYPNPLNPTHYIVLNTGIGATGLENMTAAYGDWAILNSVDRKPVAGGVFDENWQLPLK